MTTKQFVQRLSQRGMKYLEQSIITWNIREERLKGLWGEAYEVPGKEEYCRRLYRASNILWDWRREAGFKYYQMKEELQRTKAIEGEMIVMLECPAWDCRYGDNAVLTGVKYKDYEEGKLKCLTCGRTLQLKDEHKIQRMLEEIFHK